MMAMQQSPATGSHASTKRVLIVDDNPGLLTLISTYVGMLGCQVSLAGNGHEAFELFCRDPYDLVITDLQMPVMDGFELLVHIKGMSDRTPILVTTGNTDLAGEKADCLSGALDIFVKPFELKEMGAVIQDVLGNGSPA
jgi:DNA-binding response OmpR family regulator